MDLRRNTPPTPVPIAHTSGKRLRALTKVPDEELVALYLAATSLAMKLLRGDEEAAREAVNEAYLRMATTHPWDSSDRALQTHFMTLVKQAASDVKHGGGERNKQRKRREKAEKGFGEDCARRPLRPNRPPSRCRTSSITTTPSPTAALSSSQSATPSLTTRAR